MVTNNAYLGQAGPLGSVIAAGMADYIPGSADDLESVFEKADTSMYQEKERLKHLGAAARS